MHNLLLLTFVTNQCIGCLVIFVLCPLIKNMSHFQMLMNVLTARYAVKGFVKTPMVLIVASVTRGTKTHWMGKGVWVSCRFLTPVLEL